MSSNDNYPAGVTDAHPHFNPSETYTEVECTTEEALTVPSFTVKAWLHELEDHLMQKEYAGGVNHTSIKYRIIKLRKLIDEIERECDYECQWKGEQELPVSEEAEWDCPRCGVTQTTDTVPEGRDPDEGWDSRHER